jgi:hypothetical protein
MCTLRRPICRAATQHIGREAGSTGRPPKATGAHPASIGAVNTLEAVYLSLLVTTAVVVTWFAGFVVYRLYRGQR